MRSDKLILKKTSRKRKKLLFLLLALFALISVGAFVYVRGIEEGKSSPSPSKNKSTEVSKKTRDTEGSTEQQVSSVPDGVDPSSVKNYELITENEQYKIRKLDGVYTITLYAIINRPDQSTMYRDQLKEYKQNALQYLKDKNVNVNTVKILYEPQEATDL